MRAVLTLILGVLGAAAAALYSSAFIVGQNEQSLVLRFGEVRQDIREPGLNWKMPLIDIVHTLDKRVLDLDSKPQIVSSSDPQFLSVDSFTRYRIIDPKLFFQRVRTEAEAGRRLSPIVDSTVRDVLANAKMVDIIRNKREHLMKEIARLVHDQAKDLGIEIVDVRIKRADLPDANSQRIYERMRAERKQEADKIRALGAASAVETKAEADRKATVLRAEARRKSDETKGIGEGERNRIYREAFDKDPEFFRFYRRMQACEQAFRAADTKFVITPGSDICPEVSEGPAPAPARK
ncbi:MAG TPA: protease modulator HflC [Hyphomicrobiaceae bacterium]|nr:protease modulator HflC [Hyphomicrobiaceae bacterium]